jgi:hypothetical protein
MAITESEFVLRTLAEFELEGSATVTAGVELGPVEKGARVMHCRVSRWLYSSEHQ